MSASPSKKIQQPDQEDVSIIPFPDIICELPEVNTAIPETQQTPVETPNISIKPEFSNFAKRGGKFFIFLVVVGVLFYGRFSVPVDFVPCVVDKIMDGLKVANDFINFPGNESYRRGFQITGSLLIDIVFLVTFGYWIFKGTSLRLPVTLGVFYIVRAVVQKFFILPFPSGFYWDDPGFPSLVVPYGLGSDFFFSGHSGFVVICAQESFASKNKKLSYLMWLVLAYTVMTLLIYRIHYSIDIFTGVFFADWCFFRVNILVRYIDPLCFKILVKIKNYIKSRFPARSSTQQRKKETIINQY